MCLYMCMCVFICLSLCFCVCLYVCLLLCLCMCVCLFVTMCVYVSVSVSLFLYLDVYECDFVCRCLFVSLSCLFVCGSKRYGKNDSNVGQYFQFSRNWSIICQSFLHTINRQSKHFGFSSCWCRKAIDPYSDVIHGWAICLTIESETFAFLNNNNNSSRNNNNNNISNISNINMKRNENVLIDDWLCVKMIDKLSTNFVKIENIDLH